EDDLAGKLVGERRKRDRRPDAAGRHRVVPAAVTQSGERVVLREDPDPRATPGVRAAPAAPARRSDRCRPRTRDGAALRRPTTTPALPRTRSPGARGSDATAR